MGKYDDAFAPPIPGSTGIPPGQSLQASLYARLRRSRGSQSGVIGWLLVRLAQPQHRDHEAAIAAIERRPLAELVDLRAVVAAARSAAASDAVRDLADLVIAALDDAARGAT